MCGVHVALLSVCAAERVRYLRVSAPIYIDSEGRLAQTPGLWGLRFPEGTDFGRGLNPAVHFQDRGVLPETETPTRPRPAARFSHQAALNLIMVHVVQLFQPLLFAVHIERVEPALSHTR